jgi:cell division protein FtsL
MNLDSDDQLGSEPEPEQPIDAVFADADEHPCADAGEPESGADDATVVDVTSLDVTDADVTDVTDVTDVSDGAATPGPPAVERHPRARRAHLERPARIAIASLALIAIMFLFVFPMRSYLAQKRQVHSAQRSVEVLQTQNAELEREARELQTPAEIERMARVQFNMVLPGEQAYTVISPNRSTPTSTTP